MRFKNEALMRTKSGFSLMEVMAAVAIFGIIMTPLLMLQGSTYARLVRGARTLQRVWFAQEYLQRVQEKIKFDTIQFSAEEQKKFPATQLRYEISQVSSDSPFASLKDLYVESVSMKWIDNTGERVDRLVAFVFKPQLKKQEKK